MVELHDKYLPLLFVVFRYTPIVEPGDSVFDTERGRGRRGMTSEPTISLTAIMLLLYCKWLYVDNFELEVIIVFFLPPRRYLLGLPMPIHSTGSQRIHCVVEWFNIGHRADISNSDGFVDFGYWNAKYSTVGETFQNTVKSDGSWTEHIPLHLFAVDIRRDAMAETGHLDGVG